MLQFSCISMQNVLFPYNPHPIHNVIGSYRILANIRWSTVKSPLPKRTAGLSDIPKLVTTTQYLHTTHYSRSDYVNDTLGKDRIVITRVLGTFVRSHTSNQIIRFRNNRTRQSLNVCTIVRSQH